MNKNKSGLILDILKQSDRVLFLLCTISSLFGILMITSATRFMNTNRYVYVQIGATIIGFVVYFAVTIVDVEEIVRKGWKWLFIFNIFIILLLLTPLGVADNTGNRAWLKFPFFPVSIQPAEIVKITFIILLAAQLVYLKKEYDLKSVKSILFIGGHLGITFLLYYAISSDMGSALVLIFIFCFMCFIAGVALRWFVIGITGGAMMFYLMWELDKIPEYMKNRFRILFNHDLDKQGVGWHQTRSMLTLGGGKITGQGLFHGTQTQSEYSYSLPNRHTDFIFSVIGEELGFIGCLFVIVLMALIIVRCMLIAKNAKTLQDRYICVGVAGMIVFQCICNIGMCLFIMPVIGLTLPFISYGGSSVVTLYAAMGLISGVHSRSLPEWLR